MKYSSGEKMFLGFIYVAVLIMSFLMLYPVWNSMVISLNEGSDTVMGGITFWPRAFTLENYGFVIRDDRIIHAFLISTIRTLIGTLIGILWTALFAYGMSKKELIGRKFYMVFCIITMYFGGGLIPTFMVIRGLGMLDTFGVLIIPALVSVWNMIVFRAFFNGIPAELEESAKIDGAGYFYIFFRIILPLSTPVVAALSLFSAIWHWNDWFTGVIYISSESLLPIQTLLQQIMASTVSMEQLLQSNPAAMEYAAKATSITSKSIMMTTMMVATLPIICVYPFLQKYFVKGALVGSLKE